MLLPTLLSLGLSISVQGTSVCPSTAMVEARLEALLPSAANTRAHVVHLVAAGDELLVELHDGAGRLLAQKRLSFSTESCPSRADTVAVMLAAWEVQVGGVRLDLPPPPTALPALPLLPPPPKPTPPPAAKAAGKVGTPAVPLALELGAAGLGSIAGGTLAFGGALTALLGPRKGLWIAVAELEGIGPHSLSVEPGAVQWYRFALGAGPGLRLRWRWLSFEAFGLAGLSWLQLQGTGFSTDQASGDVDVSVGGGVRFAATAGKLHPWLGVRVDAWLRGERVQVKGAPGSTALPTLEVLPGAGCDLDLL